jgi:hypothetical protein
MGSRCREVEMAVLAASKRLILVSLTVQLKLITIELNGKIIFKFSTNSNNLYQNNFRFWVRPTLCRERTLRSGWNTSVSSSRPSSLSLRHSRVASRTEKSSIITSMQIRLVYSWNWHNDKTLPKSFLKITVLRVLSHWRWKELIDSISAISSTQGLVVEYGVLKNFSRKVLDNFKKSPRTIDCVNCHVSCVEL